MTTIGLAGIDRPELAVELASPTGVEEAKRTLLRFAGYVVSTNARLEAGDRFELDGERLTLEAASPGVLPVRRGRPR